MGEKIRYRPISVDIGLTGHVDITAKIRTVFIHVANTLKEISYNNLIEQDAVSITYCIPMSSYYNNLILTYCPIASR